MKFPKPSKPIHWAFIGAALPPVFIGVGHFFGTVIVGVMFLMILVGSLFGAVAAINTDL